MLKHRSAFTLIELLIVVAIIAILAAIAVPNFLEAQIRAKVARVRSDLRTVATALETYYVDNNSYPPVPNNNQSLGYVEYVVALTTPVSYINSVALADPFQMTGLPEAYQYAKPNVKWIGSFGYFRYDNSWAKSCYGGKFIRPGYAVICHGPSKTWSWQEHYPYFKITGKPHSSGGKTFSNPEDTVYDASNGTKSFGGLSRFGGIPGVPDSV